VTGDEPSAAESAALIEQRLAVAEETLRAIRAGEADAILLDSHQGEQQVYTLETEDRPYRRLVERMSEGAALVDADGRVAYANQWLATLLDVPLERLQGSPLSDWLDEPDAARFLRQLATAASGGHREQMLRRADGSTVPVLLGISDTGEPEGVLRCVTVTDLTQQKAQQHELDRLNVALTDRLAELRGVNDDLEVQRAWVEEANAKLQVVNGEVEGVNEAIRGFTAVAAHDLSSPLASIIGFSRILTDNWATLSEEDRSRFLATIDRQSHKMAGLIDDLLTVSKIEAGALDTRPEQVVLTEAISRCLETGSDDAVAVSVSCSPELVVHADPQHLGRILDNYLQNAFKYGDPPVQIEATRVGDMIEVRVLDEGPGLPPELVPRLFEKFARADTPTTRGKKGTGLGLWIVRGLAEANGGRAGYEPRAPHGSCFMVELPAVRHDPGAKAVP
jgi:PAS domain S-box-containing protein